MDNYKIRLFNKISKSGISQFDDNFEISDELKDYHGILVRSANLNEMEFSDDLLAIARAGAGTNNIPTAKCSNKGIVVFNTPGANANAVKELVIAAMIIGQRKISQAINWTQSLTGTDVEDQVEKGKSQFVGHEIYGKKLGVVGLGAIGVLVANSGLDLGMDVYGFDPFISIKAAWNLAKNVQYCKSIDEILNKCDIITIHIPYSEETKNLVNDDFFKKIKKNALLLNFSRGGLIDNDKLLTALNNDEFGLYLTDFPNESLLNNPKIITFPHLGASTDESEENCAVMAATQLKDYLEKGNIHNSVNLPNVSMEFSGNQRISLIHLNIPNMIAQISNTLSSLNIENLVNKSKENYAYTLVDINGKIDENMLKKLHSIEGMLKIRVININ